MCMQVFLPLLVEHFSESELRQLTKTVNELHHLGPQQGQERTVFENNQVQL